MDILDDMGESLLSAKVFSVLICLINYVLFRNTYKHIMFILFLGPLYMFNY